MFQHSRYHLPFRNSIFSSVLSFLLFSQALHPQIKSVFRSALPSRSLLSLRTLPDILEEITTTVSQSSSGERTTSSAVISDQDVVTAVTAQQHVLPSGQPALEATTAGVTDSDRSVSLFSTASVSFRIVSAIGRCSRSRLKT